MKFKLDENVPLSARELMREKGHDVLSVLDQSEAGASDSVVAGMVRQESRTLITLDLDFADIRSYRPADYPGIIVLRPRRRDVVSVLQLIDSVLRVIAVEPVSGRLWIAEPGRLRIRGTPDSP